MRELLIIINLSLPRRRESSDVKSFWIPAFAGMTFLEVAMNLGRTIYFFKIVKNRFESSIKPKTPKGDDKEKRGEPQENEHLA